ncbi:uncharacterized protein LOC141733659 isoform X1 [Larus michahellis]|uniref:uncharacterized protein LOC141733659 isoform X1 n=1 Tax=Larus michahellis TaxID=119627 RepID=UPI003D9B328B
MSAPSSPATTTTTTTAAASSAPPPHAAAPAAAPAAAAAPAPFDASGPDGLPRCGGVARWKDSERGTERNEQGRSYVCSRDKCWEKRKSRNRVTSQHPADPQYGKLQRIRNVSPGCLSKSDMEIQKADSSSLKRVLRCRTNTRTVDLYKQMPSFHYQPATFPAVCFESLAGMYHKKTKYLHTSTVPGLAEHQFPVFVRILGVAEEIALGSWTVC